jgi:hypothetical protein
MTTKSVNTTVGQNSVRVLVSTAVAFVIAFLTTHFGHLSTTTFAIEWPVITAAYFAGIGYLEAKFPKLSWLFLLFPQKPAVPVTPAAGSTAVK